MLTLTQAAAKHIKTAMEAQSEKLTLRVAATQKSDGTIDYAIGFDKTKLDDITYTHHDVNVIVSPGHDDLLDGATMDFVELLDGKFNFIFLNPNDANYKAPEKPAPTSATKH